MKTKICVVTGTRAEFGLLRNLMLLIAKDPDFELQVISTGTHLDKEFGNTESEIIESGFRIDQRVPILSDSSESQSTVESMSRGLLGFSNALEILRPDLLVVLGDRSEIFTAAIAAHLKRIPIAHIHGGETTPAMLDEAFRHSITKMAQIHFTAAEEYRNRVIQLGENPRNVHNVGGLGVDALNQMQLIGKQALEDALGLKFLAKSFIVTFHPVTLEESTSESQISELLSALGRLKETTLLFTSPNSDEGNQLIQSRITKFVSDHENAYLFKSLGSQTYFSCLKIVDGVIGNSSSGILEVPSARKATVNIGNRQMGRPRASSVIDCESSEDSIYAAIQYIYSPDFKIKLSNAINPYGDGGASEKIFKIIKESNLSNIVKKSFYDLFEM
jgi:GDP/UDP-N,N'-diacetylbacillosamine 2-epimerase (hydrolysing)